MADQSTAKLAGLRGTGDISVVAKESEQSLTLRIPDEDHTLGNAIRYVLHRRPDVDFAGYSIPHPAENIMNVRVQTRPANGLPAPAAIDVVTDGLNNLKEMCNHISTVFADAVAEFPPES